MDRSFPTRLSKRGPIALIGLLALGACAPDGQGVAGRAEAAEGPADAAPFSDLAEATVQHPQARDVSSEIDASRRTAMGVVPAWEPCPAISTFSHRTPWMPVTAAISRCSASSTGPCSICSST